MRYLLGCQWLNCKDLEKLTWGKSPSRRLFRDHQSRNIPEWKRQCFRSTVQFNLWQSSFVKSSSNTGLNVGARLCEASWEKSCKSALCSISQWGWPIALQHFQITVISHCQCPWQAFPDENATIITFGNVLIPMCDKTQNLNQTESETFVDTEFVLCIIPDLLKRQNPKRFLIPIFSKRIRNIFQPYTILFISNKPFQQDQNECVIQILISKVVLGSELKFGVPRFI